MYREIVLITYTEREGHNIEYRYIERDNTDHIYREITLII